MAFRYPLQSLLRLRQSMERQEEQRLFAIASLVARLRVQIEQFDRNTEELKQRTLRELMEGSSGAVLQYSALCEAASAATHKKLVAELENAESERLRQLVVYKNALQKREILEGLRDRQEAIYDLEISRREQQLIDEDFLVRSISFEDE